MLASVRLLQSTVVIKHHILVTNRNCDVVTQSTRSIFHKETISGVVGISRPSASIHKETVVNVMNLGSI